MARLPRWKLAQRTPHKCSSLWFSHAKVVRTEMRSLLIIISAVKISWPPVVDRHSLKYLKKDVESAVSYQSVELMSVSWFWNRSERDQCCVHRQRPCGVKSDRMSNRVSRKSSIRFLLLVSFSSRSWTENSITYKTWEISLMTSNSLRRQAVIGGESRSEREFARVLRKCGPETWRFLNRGYDQNHPICSRRQELSLLFIQEQHTL